MTAPLANDTPDVLYIDEPPFFARIAWPQVITLSGIGLGILAPLLLALLLAA